MNQSRRGRGGKRARNNPELAQVVIAGSSQCSYVLTERQFLVQDDPKIPDRSGKEKGREFSRKGLRVQLVQLLAGAQPNPPTTGFDAMINVKPPTVLRLL